MGVLDDRHFVQLLELKPFKEWLDPSEFGQMKVVIPESTFVEAFPMPGGTLFREKQVQRELTLEKGLEITGVRNEGGETVFRASGLIHSNAGIYSGLTPDLKAALDAQHAEYARIMSEVNDPEITAIMRENKRRVREGGGGSVWEIDMDLTEEELVLFDLAKPRRTVQTINQEFLPSGEQQMDPETAKLRGEIEALTELIRAKKEALYDEGVKQGIDNRLKHEAVNVYGMQGTFAPYLSPTWWMFLKSLDEEMGDEFHEIQDAKDCLKEPLFERLNIEPGADIDDKVPLLMGARYEIPEWGEEWQYRDAQLDQMPDALAWVDFMAGFPYGCCEMLTLAGEVTTKDDKWRSYPDEGESPVPPVPEEFFEEETYEEKKVAHDLNWLESDRVEAFIDGVHGEKNPESPNWWLRVNFKGDEKYPYPGEFFGLAVRIFPNLTWGFQKYSPFLYSGHWIDTSCITSAEAKIVEKTDEGYYICEVDWRKKDGLKVYPSDFAEYQVGERVTIMKDITTQKTSQLWKDEDCFTFDEEVWRIVPLTYYGKGFEEA